MEASGYLWPIIDAHVRFIQAVRYDDEIDVEALLVESEYRLKIAYTVRDLGGKRITRGHTVQVAVDKNTGELCLGSPNILLERLEHYEQQLGEKSA